MQVLHGDLAARNILLCTDNVVKIGDFGLARTMEDYNYIKKSRGPLPLKWLAIESIEHFKFSTFSDVWSFGIVLWEFFTKAAVPYPGIDPELLLVKLQSGYRMDRPVNATQKM